MRHKVWRSPNPSWFRGISERLTCDRPIVLRKKAPPVLQPAGEHTLQQSVQKLKCSRCHKEQPVAAFGTRSDRERGHDYYCRSCRAKIGQAWNRSHLERRRNRARQTQREYRVHLRRKIIAAYGGKCACCGESEPCFLTLDHPDGVPSSHRSMSGRRIGGFHLYQIVQREGFPPCYRLLCWNCNAARAYWGKCPHESANE